MSYKNAVLDDQTLRDALNGINRKFGEHIEKVSGPVWGLPLIDQKTKALIAVALDVANQGVYANSPFLAHVDMAVKQGATREELEELLLFCCVYSGVNKCAPAFVALNEYFDSPDANADSDSEQ